MPPGMMEAIGAAGPYMGPAIFVAVIQIFVILKATDKTFRIRALYLTIGIQVALLSAGLIVNFLRDI